MRATIFIVSLLLAAGHSFVVPLSAAKPATSLAAVTLPRVSDGEAIDLGAALAATSTGRSMLVLGTHAADFNMVEYAQKVRHFLPALRAKGVDRVMMVVNGEVSSCAKLAELLELPDEVELLADPTGEAGRRFGVSRGWRADDSGLSPFVKLFVMGIGLGDAGTLPAVLRGYVGNPDGRREWIESALSQGQLAGRWPAVLEVGDDGKLLSNKFDDFGFFGSWGCRPLELATMRLQNLIGVQAAHWKALKPTDGRCLTQVGLLPIPMHIQARLKSIRHPRCRSQCPPQHSPHVRRNDSHSPTRPLRAQLGGCTVVGAGGVPLYSWVDRGLCDVPDFEPILGAL